MESFFHGLRVWYYRTRTFCRENGGRRNMNLGFSFFFNSILLGIGLAMDAFSVSLANGLNEPE